MFREIFLFEVRYQVRQPLFVTAVAVFFILTFGAVTSDVVQIGGAIGNVHRNAPFVIMQIMLIMTSIATFLTTAFVAGAVHRDYEHDTHALFFSLPISKRDFLFGRFSGALVVALLIFSGVVLGVALGSVAPWLDPVRIGPFQAAPYLFSLITFVLPNLLLTGALFFCLATLTRSLLYTYAGLVLFFVGYGVAASLLVNYENDTLAAILDPFGLAAFGIVTKYWTVAERNTQILSLSGPLLYNRLLWVGVAVAVLAFTYVKFRFSVSSGRKGKKLATEEGTGAAIAPAATATTLETAAPVFSRATSWAQFRHQTRQEVSGFIKSVPFVIILFLGLFNIVGDSFTVDDLYGTPVYPVTHLVLGTIAGAFYLFLVILLTLYSGELVWRERGLKLAGIYDALPVPTWVMWASKLTALATMLIVLQAGAMLTGMGIQLFRGYHDFELPLYFEGLFLRAGLPFLLITVLALFVQVAVNQKYLGFLVMTLYYVSVPVMNALHFDHNLYRYANTPFVSYSDMNGYGPIVRPLFWFDLYWIFGAVILGALVQCFWVRGAETGLRQRLALARQRLTLPVKGTLAAAGLAFAATGGFIFYNTNVLNHYVPGDVREKRQVDFERKYKKYEAVENPRITATRSEVDIYPEESRVEIRGTYQLVNKTGKPLDAIHVTLNRDVTINALRLPGARLEMEDKDLGYYIYRLDAPLPPLGEMEMSFDLSLANRGFVNNNANTKVVANGTFFNNYDYFPHLGYTRAFELTDPNVRRKHSLPPVERMPKVDDEQARFNNYISREADWARFETTVSTSPDQIAIAPGYLEREWQENGRRYFHYTMDAPILNFYSFLSARYAVKRDRWNDVAIEIDYHPAHAYNVDRMIEGVKKSLDYFTKNFGPYQHRQVRIVEFPRYERSAQSFPNTIPFSESIGFIARIQDQDSIDYVFYVTAHEVAHQWWAHQVIGANVQGATVMSETMAQYSALMVMEKEYGRDKMRRFLKYELDAYLKARGGEPIEELPLILVENQPYIHYRKGSLVMYALRDSVGEEALNAALAAYVKDVGFKGPPYTTSPEFLSYVRRAVPHDLDGFVDDLFRNITLYDNRATAATWTRRADGKYVVRLSVESAKFHADGSGVETAVPVGDLIDVGVFGGKEPKWPPEGKVLALEKRRVDRPKTEFEIVVDEEPMKAGVDPFNKLIDRNPENNLTSVVRRVW